MIKFAFIPVLITACSILENPIVDEVAEDTIEFVEKESVKVLEVNQETTRTRDAKKTVETQTSQDPAQPKSSQAPGP